MRRNNSFSSHVLSLASALAVVMTAAALGSYVPNGSGTGTYPTRYVSGGLVSYVSATTASVTTSSWRDSTDTLEVRSMNAVASVDCTAAGAAGIDQKVIAQTGSSSSPTITASADVTANFDSATLQGNWSTSTTLATGFGSIALQQIAVGDLVGNSTKGWSRVTAVSSNTSVTLVAALPGGDAAANSTFTVLYAPTIWIAATAFNKRMVNTISAAGTAIVVDVLPGAIPTLAGGQTLTVGVAPNLNNVSEPNYWLHMWLRSGTSGTTATWSTQRTTPYALTGYTTAVRRVAAMPMLLNNGTPLLEFAYQQEVSPFARDTYYEDTQTFVLSNGSQQNTWTAVACNAWIPPTSTHGMFHLTYLDTNGINNWCAIRARQTGTTSVASHRNYMFGSSATGDVSAPTFLWQTDAAQAVDYLTSNAVGQNVNLGVTGFRDSL